MFDFGFEFMRPLWLLGFIPLLLASLHMLKLRYHESAWEHIVDPALQPYVIEPAKKGSSGTRWLLVLGWLICLVVLAGPVWDKQEVPVYKGQQAQVVLFDLSRSMYSDDLKPSRVARARFKLLDLLNAASGLQVALIAFAERPYVVSPLSDDANTIASFVESLDPSIMPAQGSRLDLAIEQGIELLAQAGVEQGQLVLITDSDAGAKAIASASAAIAAGHRLSVIGVGTTEGAPLRGDDGRFLQDSSGAIVVPQLKKDALNALANTGGGEFIVLSNNDDDIRQIDRVQKKLTIAGDISEEEGTNEYWIEYSPYAVVFLLLLSLLFFRRGVIW